MKKQFCPKGHDTFLVGRNNRRTCKACVLEYHKKWWKKHPEKVKTWQLRSYAKRKPIIIADAKKRFKERRELINRLKTRPCSDCNVQYNPWVMQFDHLDPKTKKMELAVMVRTSGLMAILEEAKKCEIVCANCHAERTHKRMVLKFRA